MKKILLATAVAACALTSVHAKKLDGKYAGVDVGYGWTKAKFGHKEVEGALGNLSLRGPVLFGKVGYGSTFDNGVYVGGEFRLGYNFSKKKRTFDDTDITYKVKHSWNTGVAARIGGYASDDCLIYVRLGLDYDRYKAKLNNPANGYDTKMNVETWSFVPGIGADYLVSDSLFVTGAIDYSVAFKASGLKDDLKFNSKPRTITVRVGVGSKF